MTSQLLPTGPRAIGPLKSGRYDRCEKFVRCASSIICFSHLVISYFCAFPEQSPTMKDILSSSSFLRNHVKQLFLQEFNSGLESASLNFLRRPHYSSPMMVRYRLMFLTISHFLDFPVGSHCSKLILSRLYKIPEPLYLCPFQFLIENPIFIFGCD